MKTITRKSEVKLYLKSCLEAYDAKGWPACLREFHRSLLSHKVKFPLLEYCAETFFETLDKDEHLLFCDHIQSLKTEGGNVILGKMLQLRLGEHFAQSLEKATEYISKTDIWYVCDIIGERVFGVALLTEPHKMIPEIGRLAEHPSHWVLRSLGAGSHYAIKKGLGKGDVNTVFKLLLTMANTQEKEIRQGVGWAAKTTAKFHPDIIQAHQDEIQNTREVANWFRAKIQIGLNRHAYAQRNRS